MSKLSPKRRSMLYHKIAVLSDIMIDTINELDLDNNPNGQAFKNALEITKGHCEVIVENSFKVDTQGVYINDLSNKVDTVIRKNYKDITNE